MGLGEIWFRYPSTDWLWKMDHWAIRVMGMGVEFWVTSIIVTATPGTGVVFTIAAGLTRGAKAGLVAALGCTLGIVPHLALALTGAAGVLAASRVAFEALRWLGVGYLLFMAWGTWRQSGVLAPEPNEDAERDPSTRRVIGNAILVNLLNPKLTLFFFVFLPLFVNAEADHAVVRMAGLGALFMAITLVIFALYGVCAGRLRQYVTGRPRVMRWIVRGFAASFAVLAGLLAFTRP